VKTKRGGKVSQKRSQEMQVKKSLQEQNAAPDITMGGELTGREQGGTKKPTGGPSRRSTLNRRGEKSPDNWRRTPAYETNQDEGHEYKKKKVLNPGATEVGRRVRKTTLKVRAEGRRKKEERRIKEEIPPNKTEERVHMERNQKARTQETEGK